MLNHGSAYKYCFEYLFYRLVSFCSVSKHQWPGESPRYLGPSDRPTAISTQPDGVRYRTTTLEWVVGSLTIFAIIDCAETLATVCHPSLFHKLIASGFSSCCVGLIQSFLYDRCAGVVCQNQPVAILKFVEVFCLVLRILVVSLLLVKIPPRSLFLLYKL